MIETPNRIRSRSLWALVGTAFRMRPSRGFAIFVGSSMHAAGHAFLAAAAGLLARSMAGTGDAVALRTSAAAMRFFADRSTSSAAFLLAVAGLLAAIVKLLGGALAAWAEAEIAGDVGSRVRLAVLDDVLALDRLRTPRHDDHGSTVRGEAGTHGERLAALTSHVAEIERGVAHGVLAEGRALVQLVPLSFLLVALAPKLAGSAVAALGAFAVLAFALRRAFKRANLRAAVSAALLVEASDEAVRHAELWATYGAKRRIRSHVARIGRAIAHEAARVRVRASLLSSTSEVLGALALVLALTLASRGTLGVEQSTVVPFAIAFFMAYKPLRELVDGRLAIARGDEALRLSLGPASLGPASLGPASLGPASLGPASLDERATGSEQRVTWPLDALVLDGARALRGDHAPVSVRIPHGAIAAIVGPSGIGKTSLFRALLGLDPLAEGSMHYGASSLENAGIGPNERPFAWVPQDAPVVGDTLAINVALGLADDDTDVADPAPVLAELGNETLAASVGDDVLATERRLSGGERQWIAVARAFATGLPVLLLDEPTSALDPEAQGKLLAAVARLRGKRTVLVVTHRLEPLAIADLVVRLEARVAVSNE